MDASFELQERYDAGVQFTLQPDAGRGFLVGHGDYLHKSENMAILPTFEQAVRWLGEQVRCRYPDCDYSRRLHAS
jgi:hypothetical protein